MKKKWVIGGVVILIVVGFAVWIFLPGQSVLSKKDQTAALTALLGRSVHQNNALPTTWTLYKSSVISFSYPALAKVYTDDNADARKQPNTLDSFSFNLQDDHLFVVVQAVSFPDSLNEYPAVKLRLTQNDVYKTQEASESAFTSIIFQKSADMEEKSAFYQKKGVVISVAVTGYSKEKVDDLFSKVTDSLKIY